MYDNKCVMAVMVNGKPLKERYDGTVEIPENSEYTLRFKNKNTQAVLVQFTIDGENVSGGGYVLEAGETANIKRFADTPKTFKFVDYESDEVILDGKNHNSMPGLIHARFYFRKSDCSWLYSQPMTYQRSIINCQNKPWINNTYGVTNGTLFTDRSAVGGSLNTANSVTHDYQSINSVVFDSLSLNDLSPQADSNIGVTVEGGYSDQTFSTTYFPKGIMVGECKIILRKSGMVSKTTTKDPEIQEINDNLLSLQKERDRLQKLKTLIENQKILEQEIEDLKSQIA